MSIAFQRGASLERLDAIPRQEVQHLLFDNVDRISKTGADLDRA
jgi:hypothetical protein